VITGFSPIALAGARVLILGTVPSRRSLEAGQYYAHPRNAFWPIMERLFARDAGPGNVSPGRAGPGDVCPRDEGPSGTGGRDAGPGARAPGAPRLAYEARSALLLEARVAVWDVLRAAERPGSLDADISAPVTNDFATFFARHPAVRTVFFKGTKARALWARNVAPALPAGLEPAEVAPALLAGLDLRLVTLPSTSPANAALTFADKLAAWQVVRDAVGDG
jgi:TDG/mug DNA glycosylase family protein